jgi:hypothetical protein
MGLMNNDNYVASNGVQKVGTYISFHNEQLYLRQAQMSGTYSLSANYRVYWDEATCMAELQPIDLKNVNTLVTSAQLNNNLYETLYDVLKTTYPNTNNVLKVAMNSSGPSGSSGSFQSSGPSGSFQSSGPSGSFQSSSPSGSSGSSGSFQSSGPSGSFQSSGPSGSSGSSGSFQSSGSSGSFQSSSPSGPSGSSGSFGQN